MFRHRLMILTVAVVLIGGLFTAWMARYADCQMRKELLVQARLVAGAIDTARIKALAGTEADLDKPDYLQLKEHLAAVCAANTKCRFVYLMGRKVDGKVFFFADSEPAGSEDESPAGQVYEEASVEFLHAFDIKAELAEGPVVDRWGTWISVVVPLIDQKTGENLAMLGMDIDARDWKWEVAANAAFPVGIVMVVVIGLAALLFALGRVNASPKPVLQQLMPTLTIILVLLFVIAGALLYHQFQERLNERTNLVANEVQNDLHKTLELHTQMLATAMNAIMMDDRVRQGLKSGDRQQLLADWKPLYEIMHKEQNLTHFYFSDANRVCLLRLHKPGKFGDCFERFTIREAERTGKTASGIELGPLGTFTLRVVTPVFDGPTLLGYIELGKEIEDVLRTIHTNKSGVEVAVTIKKEIVNRQAWEAGMQMLGRQADWDRLSHSVIIYASQGKLADAFAAFADYENPVKQHITIDNRVCCITAIPLKDASSTRVGNLLVINDITTLKAEFKRYMAVGSSAGATLMAVLFALIVVMLHRTDASILAQQKVLHESEAFQRELLLDLPAGVAIVDPASHQIEQVNKYAASLFGAPMDHLVGQKCHAFLCPAEENACPVCDLGKTVDNSEHIMLCADGSRIPILKTVKHVSLNGKKKLLECFVDISERKRVEEELKVSESGLRAITDTAQDAIIKMDSRGIIMFWNPAAERILGYLPAEAIGRNLHELLAPERFHAAHSAAFPEFLRSGRGAAVGKTVELAARRKDGEEIMVALSLSAVSVHDEWHAVGILRDITARKVAEDKLKNALDETEKINRILEEQTANANHLAAAAEAATIAKSEFLANMSHEIRTPMNGVIGMTGLLLDTELSAEQRQYAEIIRSSGESLMAIINDILDFSKIEAGKLNLEAIDFDLRDLLEEFGPMMAMRAHEKGLELICAAHPDVPSCLKGDPGRLRQILINLTGNAIKFTSSGEVAVRVELDAKTNDQAILRFSVCDTGIGIPADKIDLLFDKFTQVDASTTRKYGGTGLGLAISKQLAQMMGGNIGINSKEGKGSEFWFTVKVEMQASQGRSRKKPAAICGKRILIVDDNATNLEILKLRLVSWGAQVTEAASGPAALETMAQAKTPFDIVITDMQMPDMDGLMLGRAIRQKKQFKDIPLLLMTSLGRHNHSELADAGFAASLTKPVRPSELHLKLVEVLGGTQPDKTVHPAADSTAARMTFDGKIRILLAEDNITNQQVAIGMLKKLGLKADAVANGAESVKALETIPYDIVLMDVQMPEMDGLEATRQIRISKSVRNPNIPIIAMTANAMQGDRDKCLEAGMDDYISKPVNIKSLAEKLEKWFAAKPQTVSYHEAEKSCDVETKKSIFDQAELLERMMGDSDMAQQIIEVFLDDIPKQLEFLKLAAKEYDLETFQRIVHSIKGAAANVSGESLRQLAADIEQACKEGRMESAADSYPKLYNEFEQFKNAMTQINIT